MTEQQLHILIGCADARDLSQLQVDAIRVVSETYQAKGIDVIVHMIRAAGSFVTPDVVMDVKRLIEDHQRTSPYPELPTRYFVHIQSHGHFTEDSSKEYVSHVHNLHLVDGSPLNCGMLGASGVAVEIEELLLKNQPKVQVRSEGRHIKDEEDIRWLLRTVYAYDGYLAGDWIRSIDLLRTHPRRQRRVLEDAIRADNDLTTLDIAITAGIQDYAIHALIRVDGGEPRVPFWDETQAYIRQHATDERFLREVLFHQSKKQKPLAGLLCSADPRTASRTAAAQYYLKYKNLPHVESYLPNTIFNITGSSFDMPLTPFGPYVIAGFYYAVHHLALKDQMVLGPTETQTQRIMQKLRNDPIMRLIIETEGVNLIPLNNIDLVGTP
jgi:hypothetical protein